MSCAYDTVIDLTEEKLEVWSELVLVVTKLLVHLGWCFVSSVWCCGVDERVSLGIACKVGRSLLIVFVMSAAFPR